MAGHSEPARLGSQDLEEASTVDIGSGKRQACAFFLKTGNCAFGDQCKFEHPLNQPQTQYNSLGLPLRPGEQDCAYYVKNLHCGYGASCKFHHAEPVVGWVPVPMMEGVNMQMRTPQMMGPTAGGLNPYSMAPSMQSGQRLPLMRPTQQSMHPSQAMRMMGPQISPSSQSGSQIGSQSGRTPYAYPSMMQRSSATAASAYAPYSAMGMSRPIYLQQSDLALQSQEQHRSWMSPVPYQSHREPVNWSQRSESPHIESESQPSERHQREASRHWPHSWRQ